MQAGGRKESRQGQGEERKAGGTNGSQRKSGRKKKGRLSSMVRRKEGIQVGGSKASRQEEERKAEVKRQQFDTSLLKKLKTQKQKAKNYGHYREKEGRRTEGRQKEVLHAGQGVG